MKHGFVIAAGKEGHWFFRSFHKSRARANRALRMAIDVDALIVVEADVTFATNGAVRMWRMRNSEDD